jgi:hypothetical protein
LMWTVVTTRARRRIRLARKDSHLSA